MGTVDPYSSSVCEVLDLMGEKEGYKQVIRACNGVVACLLPYHWECIPRREQHLRIALDTFGYPFVVYSPDINLSPNERSTVKEVKRLMSVIPTCIRMKNAIRNLQIGTDDYYYKRHLRRRAAVRDGDLQLLWRVLQVGHHNRGRCENPSR